MTLKEILERQKEISSELELLQGELEKDSEDINVDEIEEKANKLLEERQNLLDEKTKIEDEKEKRNKLLGDIAEGRKGIDINNLNLNDEGEDRKMIQEKLYRSAFLKHLQGKELTAEERASFTHDTENSKILIPTQTTQMIYNMLGEVHPIVGDVRKIQANGMFRMIRHTAITQGDAKAPGEGKANDDEQNEFMEVILGGKKISKHVKLTMELKNMAIDSFESYLVQEIGQRIESQMAKEIITAIKDTKKGIDAENKFEVAEAGTLALADVLKGLSLLKEVGTTYVYANRADIYGKIAQMENTNQTVNFITDLSQGIKGNLLGNGIKQEDALADGEILILDPSKFIWNEVAPLEILRDREVTTGDYIIAGHTIGEGGMEYPKAGALITVGEGV